MRMRFFEKDRVPTSEEVKKVAMLGKELNVNPSPQLTLRRLENRLKRVEAYLEKRGDRMDKKKREKMERTSRRLQLEIILRKGEI